MQPKIMFASFAVFALLQAQQDSSEIGTRRLWDTNLQNQRPPAKQSSGRKRDRSNIQENPDAYVGITLWRLRPKKSSDGPAARMLVHPPESNRAEEWTPERLEVNTPLSQGQIVRISVETAREGYLYIVDSEKYADGANGDAELIFPTLRTRGGRNKVIPGEVVEIPSWDDSPQYFLVKRKRPDQVAEVLTVIVAPEPIQDLNIGEDPLRISTEQLALWKKQWGTEVKELDAVGEVAKPYTRVEADAGKGLKLLNAEDPLPQTMYYVKARAGNPLLVTVLLRIQ